jgi:V8-like Glu-specific endopeptidase
VIGYPKGSPFIQLSLHDTLLLESEGRHAHYRSPTEPGSSGSPVFDDQWQVIALHHRSVATFPGSTEPANEGVRIDALTEAFEQDRRAERAPGDP